MRAVDATLADGRPLLSPEALSAYRAHAIECYPEECFGIVDAAGLYVPLENVSPKPRESAYTTKGVLVRYLEAGDLRALCHSHPDGLDCPSAPDMEAQNELLVPFIVCATDGFLTSDPFAWGDSLVDDRDIVGRPFRHGVDDCYGIVRAYWWREFGVRLPDYPRNWEWWSTGSAGEDLYNRFFKDAGFYEIEASEVRNGDAFLCAIRSDVPNHAGVVLDAGLCLHHSSGGRHFDPNRLSRREPLAKWFPFVTHWLRR